MALTKATFSMVDGAVSNVLDFGADPTASAAVNTAAFQAAANTQKVVYIPGGEYLINDTITFYAAVYGDGANEGQGTTGGAPFTLIRMTDNTKNAFEFAALVDYLHIHDFRIRYNSRGTGHGLVLINESNNTVISRIYVQNANRGFFSQYTSFIQTYEYCRTDDCNIGWYVDGFDPDAPFGGEGTLIRFVQCYSNRNIDKGFYTNLLTDVQYEQPSFNYSATATAEWRGIHSSQVKNTTVRNLYSEGTPNGPGSLIFCAGSNTAILEWDGGVVFTGDISALLFHYVDFRSVASPGRVTVSNVFSTITVGANNFFRIDNNGGVTTNILTFGNRIPNTNVTLTGLLGSVSSRDLDTFIPVLAAGDTTVTNGTTVDSGIPNLDARRVMVQVRTDNDSLSTVGAQVVETFVTVSTFRVRFFNLSDGTENNGTYRINWIVL
jgi:hypothetical protein